MSANFLVLCLVLTIIVIAAGQQTFQKKGEFYNAKVAIHRFKPQSNGGPQVDTPLRQPLHRTIHHRRNHHPWRQRDRITKEEVVQNLARSLLSRKMTSEEMQNERRKNNREKLREYAIYQARLAEKSKLKKLEQSPQNPPLPPVISKEAEGTGQEQPKPPLLRTSKTLNSLKRK